MKLTAAITFAVLVVAAAATSGKFQVESESPLGNGILGAYTRDLERVLYGSAPNLTIRSLKTGQEKQLHTEMTAVDWMGWSPDGRSIYYRSGRRLFRCNADSGACAQVLDHVSGIPAFSADGASIAFASIAFAYDERSAPPGDRFPFSVMLAAADGKNVRKLFSSLAIPTHLEWSPDGSALAVASYVPGRGNESLHLISVATGTVTDLASLPPGEVEWTAWPAGAGGFFYTFFAKEDEHEFRASFWNSVKYTWNDGQIWFCPVPGGAPYQITKVSPGYHQIFGATPDGRTLIVYRNTPMPGYWELVEGTFSGKLAEPEAGKVVQLRVKQ